MFPAEICEQPSGRVLQAGVHHAAQDGAAGAGEEAAQTDTRRGTRATHLHRAVSNAYLSNQSMGGERNNGQNLKF